MLGGNIVANPDLDSVVRAREQEGKNLLFGSVWITRKVFDRLAYYSQCRTPPPIGDRCHQLVGLDYPPCYYRKPCALKTTRGRSQLFWKAESVFGVGVICSSVGLI